MNDRIEPALTPEEWAYFMEPGRRKHALRDAVDAVERDRPEDITPHGLAALALHRTPEGFTRDMLDGLRAVLAHTTVPYKYPEPSGEQLVAAAAAVDRIAALLSPVTYRYPISMAGTGAAVTIYSPIYSPSEDSNV